MAGNQFQSRQAAIDDANECMREKYGADVTFPDGNKGYPPEKTHGLVAASGFRVVDRLGHVLAQYVVYERGNGFTWQEASQA